MVFGIGVCVCGNLRALHVEFVERIFDAVAAQALPEVLRLLVDARVAEGERVVVVRDLESGRTNETFRERKNNTRARTHARRWIISP